MNLWTATSRRILTQELLSACEASLGCSSDKDLSFALARVQAFLSSFEARGSKALSSAVNSVWIPLFCQNPLSAPRPALRQLAALLSSCGPDPELRSNGWRALDRAVELGDLPLIRAFLEAGSRADHRGPLGLPDEAASSLGHSDEVIEICRHAKAERLQELSPSGVFWALSIESRKGSATPTSSLAIFELPKSKADRLRGLNPMLSSMMSLSGHAPEAPLARSPLCALVFRELSGRAQSASALDPRICSVSRGQAPSLLCRQDLSLTLRADAELSQEDHRELAAAIAASVGASSWAFFDLPGSLDISRLLPSIDSVSRFGLPSYGDELQRAANHLLDLTSSRMERQALDAVSQSAPQPPGGSRRMAL